MNRPAYGGVWTPIEVFLYLQGTHAHVTTPKCDTGCGAVADVERTVYIKDCERPNRNSTIHRCIKHAPAAFFLDYPCNHGTKMEVNGSMDTPASDGNRLTFHRHKIIDGYVVDDSKNPKH